MTKNEFLLQLADKLRKNNVADADDIVSEYEQHFAFKMADGYSEEEITAKLGDPASLAVQFECSTNAERHTGRKLITIIGLCFADLFAGAFYMLLIAWSVIMAAFSLTCVTAAVCLLGGFNICSLIPPIPYWCGAVFGLSFAALAVLAAVGCVYFTAFVLMLMRSFGRFHHNSLAAASGRAVLPPLAVSPRFAQKTNRRIRSVALVSLAVFAACFVLGMIVSILSSGGLEFWHKWGWFGYTGL